MGLDAEELAALSQEEKDARFRISCGAYVEGAENCYKGEKVKHDLRAAKKLRAAGADVDSKDAEGWSALHWAAAEGRSRVITYLLESGAFVDAVDPSNCSPLWAASYNGEYQAALLLLAGGADLTIKGQPKGDAIPTTPGLAARSQSKASIADLIDAEKELREKDPRRVARLKAGEMALDDFKKSLKAKPASEARILPISMNPYR